MMKILILLLISITKEKLTFPFSIGNLTGTFYNKHIDNNISTNVYIGDPIIQFPLSIKLRQFPLLLADVMLKAELMMNIGENVIFIMKNILFLVLEFTIIFILVMKMFPTNLILF